MECAGITHPLWSQDFRSAKVSNIGISTNMNDCHGLRFQKMTMLSPMEHPRHSLILPLLIALPLSISACGRETYTSWNCQGDTGNKILMVLRKAQMNLQGTSLNYCGSLGEKSYFDSSCPAVIEQSRVTFIPNTGVLLDQQQVFHCEAI
jgi:hypothetical protein